MPDLQSELAKVNEALASWEEPSTETTMTSSSPRSAFKETNGVSRATFNYVRDNPGSRRVEIISGLEALGFKPSSTSSLLAQMHNQNMIRSVNDLWFVNQHEYAPLKASKAFKNAKAKAEKAKPVKTKKAPAELPVTMVEVPAAKPVKAEKADKEWSPDDVIESLNVKQAMAVYDALHKIFRL